MTADRVINPTSTKEQPVSTATSNLNLAEEMLSTPKVAFRNLLSDYPWMFPFFLVLTSSLVAWFFYFSTVDIDWLARHQVEMWGRDLTQEQTERVLKSLTREYQLISAAVTVLVLVPTTYLLHALYFRIVSAVQGDRRGFREWFSFVAWASLPTFFALVAMLVYVAVGDDRIPTEELNVLSVDSLFLNLDPRSPYKSVLSNLSLTTFWSVFLMFVGYRDWLSVSSFRTLWIVVLPYLLFFGGWAAVAAG